MEKPIIREKVLGMPTRAGGAAEGQAPEIEATGERMVTGDVSRHAVEHLHRYALALDHCPSRDVLDIASGEGYGSSLMAGAAASVVGVDVDPEAVEHAGRKYRAPNLRFLRGRADEIPLGDDSVDLVVSFETIEHHDRHEEMMLEIRRVLRDGGLMIMSSPDKKYFSDEIGHRNPFHVKELYEEEFRDLARRHFRNVRLLSQRVMYASVLAGEGAEPGLVEYGGDFSKIRAGEGVGRPEYHVCLASDAPLPPVRASVFDGTPMLEEQFRLLAHDVEQREWALRRKEAEWQGLLKRLPLGAYRAARRLLGR